MLSLENVKNIRFSKANIGGYKPEEVDEFIFEVEKTFEAFEKERNENLKTIKKLKENSEKYWEEAGYIKDVLVNAKKIAEEEIKEAKYKATRIINEAIENSKERINEIKIKEQEQILDRLKKEVDDFKTHVLNEYKNHLKALGMVEKNLKIENEQEKKESLISSFENEKISNFMVSEDSDLKRSISEKFQKLGGIKFGDKYKIENDDESPVNLFSSK